MTHDARRRRIGVIGTFVWDVIYGQPPHDEPVEDWGGITYALSGLSAAIGDEWEIVPVIKVGADRIAAARDFMSTLSHISSKPLLVEVPEKNNCSELHYFSEERRSERLTGGVPGWTWAELQPLLERAGLDALHVNFLSGWELDLETAQQLRSWFRGPIYADIHMKAWSVPDVGNRELAPVEHADEWCGCFDVLQMNEDELVMMSSSAQALSKTSSACGVREVLITLGKRGVLRLPAGADGLGAVYPPERVREGPRVDPTGCGDVWGATYFARTLSGDSVDAAMARANRAAGINAEYRGVRGLSAALGS